jgi:hypothetical protein
MSNTPYSVTILTMPIIISGGEFNEDVREVTRKSTLYCEILVMANTFLLDI